jgi:hypothetical protein
MISSSSSFGRSNSVTGDEVMVKGLAALAVSQGILRWYDFEE